MGLGRSRLRREAVTIEKMVAIYCAEHHAGEPRRPCLRCQRLLTYARQRLKKCPYGARKPACAKCPIHCYKRAERQQIRQVMRYAGPRMMTHSPYLAFMHLVDKLRTVEHPMEVRRKRTGGG
jgi:hypothetical protein